ncbi:MAG: TOMM precursor leader peptide-binding protein [Holophagales bacterium]|nr:TOMM precursor leader peptide-binding protein [Holophagales bacterium]
MIPRFKGHLTVEWGDDSPTLLVHEERSSTRLESPLLHQVAPWIDGRRTVAQIAAELSPAVTPLDVAFAVDCLRQQGFVEHREGMGRRGEAGESRHDPDRRRPGRDAETLAEALGERIPDRSPGLAITVLGGADLHASAARIEADLLDAGATLVAEGDLRLVVVDDWMHPGLAEVHERAEASGEPWLLAQPVGVQVAVGPLFVPGRSSCWHCFAARVGAWRRERRRPLAAVPENGPGSWAPRRPSTAWSRRLGLAWAVLETMKTVWGEGRDGLVEELRVFDLVAGTTESHRWVRRPGCGHCGGPIETASGPDGRCIPEIDPGPRPPAGSSRGPFGRSFGGRAESPRKTFETYEHLSSPIAGLVDGVRPYHHGDDGLVFAYEARFAPPTPLTTPPGAPTPPEPPQPPIAPGRCAGRGTDPDSARTAALCEALERYSGFFQGYETRRLATFDDLGEAAVHPDECLLASDRQLAERRAWNQRGLPFHELPEPLESGRKIHWTPLWSLVHGRRRWLPTSYCYYNFREPSGCSPSRADSNGCAAGSRFEEAVVRGFLELVERDALALWWYNRAMVPALDLTSVSNPYVEALVHQWAAWGRSLLVLDITTDFGIPTFVAISRHDSPKAGDVLLGAGCHWSPHLALSGALTELNQFVPGFLAGRPRQALSDEPGLEASYLGSGNGRAEVALGDLEAPARQEPDLEECGPEDLGPEEPSARTGTQLERCIDLARDRGLDLLVLDQTRPEVGLPVARVVMPGSRSMRARFAPGRLYRVPVELGWVERELGEDELNPVHILI